MAKVKGTVVVEMVKMLQAHRKQALTLLSPKTAHYLEDKIVIASWYPLEEFVEMVRVLSRVAPMTGGMPVCEKMGRDMARTHMDGTYSRFKGSADRKAGSALLASLYDTGEMLVLEREPGRAVVELARFALPCREICDSITGYQYGRLALMGFEDLSVKHTKCRAVGQPNCIWEMSWKTRPGEDKAATE
jgi:hypothetical protein